jgi:hypothetical protein
MFVIDTKIMTAPLNIENPAHSPNEVIRIAQPTISRFSAIYHPPSELVYLGDRDGVDYMPIGKVEKRFQTFRTTGATNEDYFGYGMEALAPVAGLVTTVNHPTGVNPIGTMNASPVGLLEIKTKEDVNLLIAHLDNIKVKVGDEVSIGSVIGTISNNGFSRAPHLHIGAYKNDRPVLVEFCRISMDNAFKIYSSNEKCLTFKGVAEARNEPPDCTHG